MEILENVLSKKIDAKVIDIGAGKGIVSFAICEKFKKMQVTAVDKFNVKSLKAEAQQRGFSNMEVYQVDKVWDMLFLKDKSFDVAICKWVLHHIEKPQKTIQEVGRILKDQGIFLLSDAVFPEYSRSILHPIYKIREESYARHHTYYELIDLLEETGFKVKIVRPDHFIYEGGIEQYLKPVPKKFQANLKKALIEIVKQDQRLKQEMKLFENLKKTFFTYYLVDILATKSL